jgi:hypothetical protein
MVLAADPPDISTAGPISLIDRCGAGLVDQRHAALDHAVVLRKRSSVCTNISKIALPIPRTSYFAEVIYQSCYGN